METAAQAKARLASQIDYGKWNVASATNDYHAARLREMSQARRALVVASGKAFDAAIFAASYALLCVLITKGLGLW